MSRKTSYLKILLCFIYFQPNTLISATPVTSLTNEDDESNVSEITFEEDHESLEEDHGSLSTDRWSGENGPKKPFHQQSKFIEYTFDYLQTSFVPIQFSQDISYSDMSRYLDRKVHSNIYREI